MPDENQGHFTFSGHCMLLRLWIMKQAQGYQFRIAQLMAEYLMTHFRPASYRLEHICTICIGCVFPKLDDFFFCQWGHIFHEKKVNLGCQSPTVHCKKNGFLQINADVFWKYGRKAKFLKRLIKRNRFKSVFFQGKTFYFTAPQLPENLNFLTSFY